MANVTATLTSAMALYSALRNIVCVKHGALLQHLPQGIYLEDSYAETEDHVRIQIGSFAPSDTWDEMIGRLLCVDVSIFSDHVYLDWVVVPETHRRQGIAKEIMAEITSWVKGQHAGFTQAVFMADISPDYNERMGITTHLVELGGLKAIDPDVEHEEEVA